MEEIKFSITFLLEDDFFYKIDDEFLMMSYWKY